MLHTSVIFWSPCWYAEDSNEQEMDSNPPRWVALAVVQSYNPRRKVPRSKISIPDLEHCLSKASFSAAQNSGKALSYSVKSWTCSIAFLVITPYGAFEIQNGSVP